jgi:hypothetical protein
MWCGTTLPEVSTRWKAIDANIELPANIDPTQRPLRASRTITGIAARLLAAVMRLRAMIRYCRRLTRVRCPRKAVGFLKVGCKVMHAMCNELGNTIVSHCGRRVFVCHASIICERIQRSRIDLSSVTAAERLEFCAAPHTYQNGRQPLRAPNLDTACYVFPTAVALASVVMPNV